MVQIPAPRWPNDISSAADNAIFKIRAQNIECSFDCTALLLKPNVANILLFNICEQKFVQHGPIMIVIDYNGLSLLIFEKKWPNYASAPKSAQNSDSLCVQRLFNVCVGFSVPQMRQFCPPKSKWASFKKKIFFAKIGIFCKSIAGPLSKALFKRIHNHIRSAEG